MNPVHEAVGNFPGGPLMVWLLVSAPVAVVVAVLIWMNLERVTSLRHRGARRKSEKQAAAAALMRLQGPATPAEAADEDARALADPAESADEHRPMRHEPRTARVTHVRWGVRWFQWLR